MGPHRRTSAAVGQSVAYKQASARHRHFHPHSHHDHAAKDDAGSTTKDSINTSSKHPDLSPADTSRCHKWYNALATSKEYPVTTIPRLDNVDPQSADVKARKLSSEQGPHRLKPPRRPLLQMYGPFLKFHDVDLVHHLWLGSALLVVHNSMDHPILKWTSEVTPFDINICTKTVLSKNCVGSGYDFVRYDFRIPLYNTDEVEAKRMNNSPNGTASATVINHLEELIVGPIPKRSPGDIRIYYRAEKEGAANEDLKDVSKRLRADIQEQTGNRGKLFSFHVPALDKPWHWSFYSCNGFSAGGSTQEAEDDGIRPLWRDVLRTHEERPLHMIFGCGDQIYQDDFFSFCDSIETWLSNLSSLEREAAPFTDEMKSEIEVYFLTHYLAHFTQPVMADAMTSIPHMMLIDDHDIFDGYGSYPRELQQCDVFQGIGEVARLFYLLFQHHTNIERAHKLDNLIGGENGYSFVRNLGPFTAICGVDGRWERNIRQITSEMSYDMMSQSMYNLSETCQHLIVATGVPMTFPVLGKSEKIMAIIGNIRRKKFFRKIFSKFSFYKVLGYNFGLPSNLDDLIDHMNSPAHINERNKFYHLLAMFSKEKHCRVSLIAGDVHCAALGKFKLKPRRVGGFFYKLRQKIMPTGHKSSKGKSTSSQHLSKEPIPDARDPTAMFTIVSSAIGNEPPPPVALGMFKRAADERKIKGEVVDGYKVTESMVHLFEHDTNNKSLRGNNMQILGRRNWCEVDEVVDASFYEVVDQNELIESKVFKKKYAHEVIRLKDSHSQYLPEELLPSVVLKHKAKQKVSGPLQVKNQGTPETPTTETTKNDANNAKTSYFGKVSISQIEENVRETEQLSKIDEENDNTKIPSNSNSTRSHKSMESAPSSKSRIICVSPATIAGPTEKAKSLSSSNHNNHEHKSSNPETVTSSYSLRVSVEDEKNGRSPPQSTVPSVGNRAHFLSLFKHQTPSSALANQEILPTTKELDTPEAEKNGDVYAGYGDISPAVNKTSTFESEGEYFINDSLLSEDQAAILPVKGSISSPVLHANDLTVHGSGIDPNFRFPAAGKDSSPNRNQKTDDGSLQKGKEVANNGSIGEGLKLEPRDTSEQSKANQVYDEDSFYYKDKQPRLSRKEREDMFYRHMSVNRRNVNHSSRMVTFDDLIPWRRIKHRAPKPFSIREILAKYGHEVEVKDDNSSLSSVSSVSSQSTASISIKDVGTKNGKNIYELADEELTKQPILVSVFRLHVEKERVVPKKTKSQIFSSSFSSDIDTPDAVMDGSEMSQPEDDTKHHMIHSSTLPSLTKHYFEDEFADRDPIFYDTDYHGKVDGGVEIYSIPIPRLY